MTGLAAWIWQGLIVAAITALLLRLVPRLNAATRHVGWWIALVMVLMRPWTFWYRSAAAPIVSDPAIGAVSGTPLLLPAPPPWIVAAVAIAWMLFAVWRTCSIARSLRFVAALKRGASPLDALRERQLPLWRSLAPTRRQCALLVTDHAAGACALGFFRPVILVPRPLATRLSDAELDQVIAHEHAHLLRYDDWLRLLQCCIAAVAGLHPAVWLIGRQIDLERETACDDRVVARTGAARAYARCLTRVSALLARQQDALELAPAVTRSGALLQSRVLRLLDRTRNRTARVARVPSLAFVAALAVVVAVFDRMPPLVAFSDAGVVELPDVSRSSSPAPAVVARRAVAAPELLPSTSPSSSTMPPMHTDRSEPAPLAIDRAVSVPAAVGHAEAGLPVAVGTPITWAPPLIASPAPLLDSAGSPAPALPPAQPERTDFSWSDVGTGIARAGLGAGRSAQHVGRAIGGFFARAPWTGQKQERH